jgi:hypothetical protein
MIAVTATFIVIKYQPTPVVWRILTVLTDLTEIARYDATAPALPTYDEAVTIATARGLSRQPRLGFVKHFGVTEYVSVCERIVMNGAHELDGLAASMV